MDDNVRSMSDVSAEGLGEVLRNGSAAGSCAGDGEQGWGGVGGGLTGRQCS